MLHELGRHSHRNKNVFYRWLPLWGGVAVPGHISACQSCTVEAEYLLELSPSLGTRRVTVHESRLSARTSSLNFEDS